jgi:hypothetical protein
MRRNPRGLKSREKLHFTPGDSAMKTFYEYFLDEVVRKQEAGEIDAEKAERWIFEVRKQLQEYGRVTPGSPIVRMPVEH